ncbi:hypothetical protein SDRG_10641 [Saprolegnia diclina VS20]|uniref:Peptidase C51 domain-containing protein n=1 Tax=Saprolegnia diclina (strain VS20) TaxID=1156394 RepID=T0RP43_SAPDV|nr:hypothetical protein SDRG_10641 [Saprolegnia diclina VS20]EQC31857.1 hypothetical protein SDRG_10641 [Saprolegnia diclina VS20]|eukprot:XP_008614864.1 hypothetical protein SDRG_10641 [Saprolegnia diclina VS20]
MLVYSLGCYDRHFRFYDATSMHKATLLLVFLLGLVMAVPAPFGSLLGVTHGNTSVFSCDHPPEDNPNYHPPGTDESNGTYTGLRWQCVELARRYLFINRNLLFASVDGAVDIFNLTTITDVGNNVSVPFVPHAQGSATPPVRGSLLIYKDVGKYAPWGHVAVVVDVESSHIDIAEQNVEDSVWPPGQGYSRRLNVTRSSSSFTVGKYYRDDNEEVVLGWMTAALHPAC